MSGDFLRGGVLFTALPLAGAAREYSTITITAAIALMSGVEIIVLSVAYRLIRHVGIVAMLIASFALGTLCAALLALTPGATTYLVVSALFGVSLAGATASLPVLVVAQVGESSAGLAKFRISAGIGILIGSVGCAVLGTQIGIAALFALIAIVLLGSVQLAHCRRAADGLQRNSDESADARSPLTIDCSNERHVNAVGAIDVSACDGVHCT